MCFQVLQGYHARKHAMEHRDKDEENARELAMDYLLHGTLTLTLTLALALTLSLTPTLALTLTLILTLTLTLTRRGRWYG